MMTANEAYNKSLSNIESNPVYKQILDASKVGKFEINLSSAYLQTSTKAILIANGYKVSGLSFITISWNEPPTLHLTKNLGSTN